MKRFNIICFILFIYCNGVYCAEIEPATVNRQAEAFYPGPLEIPVNKLHLKGKELVGEELFAQELQLDLDLSERLYDQLPSSSEGKILDIDIVRKLFPPFDDGLIGANTYTQSTHVPASQFINYLYFSEIDRIGGSKKNPEIIFMAGGGGSGKGVTFTLFPKNFESADIVLDGTLANAEKAKNRINYALGRGFKVTVIYVFRPIELAVKGIVDRALETGRGVPIIVAATDHYDAQKTVLSLVEEFGDQIHILVVSNTGGFGDVKIIDNIEDLLSQKDYNYQSKDEVIMRGIITYLDYIKKLSPELKKKLSPELKDSLEKGMESYTMKFSKAE